VQLPPARGAPQDMGKAGTMRDLPHGSTPRWHR
jgi:hypothetical protein